MLLKIDLAVWYMHDYFPLFFFLNNFSDKLHSTKADQTKLNVSNSKYSQKDFICPNIIGHANDTSQRYRKSSVCRVSSERGYHGSPQPSIFVALSDLCLFAKHFACCSAIHSKKLVDSFSWNFCLRYLL